MLAEPILFLFSISNKSPSVLPQWLVAFIFGKVLFDLPNSQRSISLHSHYTVTGPYHCTVITQSKVHIIAQSLHCHRSISLHIHYTVKGPYHCTVITQSKVHIIAHSLHSQRSISLHSHYTVTGPYHYTVITHTESYEVYNMHKHWNECTYDCNI